MRRGLVFAILAALVIAARLCHSGVLWADDTLPLAAAGEVLLGKTLYRDIWFDKPPLAVGIQLLWLAREGWPLRIGGALYVLLAGFLAYRAARARWGEKEGLAAASLLVFFLTFGLPSAVIPAASDMLLIAPHLAAVWMLWSGRPFLAGVAAGVGLLASSKALLVLAFCLISAPRLGLWIVLGFLLPQAVHVVYLFIQGAASDFWRQTWRWGSIYAAGTFVEQPVREGLIRTLNWSGFHAALVVGAAVSARSRRDFAWIGISLAGVVLGLRFFPRYYFLLLVPMTVLAAYGWCRFMAKWPRCAIAVLIAMLAIPAIRFGPRYIQMARREPWSDLRLDDDSRAAAQRVRDHARPGDTLFVWGFRPEIFVRSGLPAATRFLETQPLSGVLADRHLFRSDPVTADFLLANRIEARNAHPTFIVDGVGLLNPRLALADQDEFAGWLLNYVEIARTDFSVIYRLR